MFLLWPMVIRLSFIFRLDFLSSNDVAFTGSYPVKARNRAGGPPIYGKVVHKAPAGSRFRNGMRHSPRSFDKIPPYYGTINAYPPSPRRRPSSYRTMGGGSPPLSQVPQAGRFQDLRNMMRAERLRELQVNKQIIAMSNAGLSVTRVFFEMPFETVGYSS